MIVFRYLLGEVFKSQLAVFVILITIILSQRFVKILADASEGELPGQMVLALISLKLPQLAVLILPLAAFLGVLIAFGRIYAESEMTVLHATGMRLVMAMVGVVVVRVRRRWSGGHRGWRVGGRATRAEAEAEGEAEVGAEHAAWLHTT